MEVAMSVAQALSSYTVRVLSGAYTASDEAFASLTWPEQFMCLLFIDVLNQFANQFIRDTKRNSS